LRGAFSSRGQTAAPVMARGLDLLRSMAN